MQESIISQLLEELKVVKPSTTEEKTATIVCNVDGELMNFADEKALKKFMFKERVDTVIRYNLVGEVTFPIELETTKIN